MSRSFNLDVAQAKAGDNISAGNRITEGGKYIGVFTEAKGVVSSQKSTEGIEFKFEDVNGKEARYLTLWTYSADGKPLGGAAQVQALMLCLKTKSIAPVPGIGKMYDPATGKEIDATVDLYPALMQKPVGIVLQREFSTKTDGSDKTSFNLNAFFNHETGQTATEMVDKVDAAAIDAMLRTLQDVDNRRPSGAAVGEQPAQQSAPAGGQPDQGGFDDDIPW